MSERIFKYEIETGPFSITKLTVPNNFNPIHTGLDPEGMPCIWMEVGTGDPLCLVEVLTLGTGAQTSGIHNHVGSFVQGPYVWHAYMRRI